MNHDQLEKNKEIALALSTSIMNGKWDKVAELLSDDFCYIGDGGAPMNKEQYIGFMKNVLCGAMVDMDMKFLRVIAEGIVTTLFMCLSGQAAQSIDFMNLGISLCMIFLHLYLISLLILASHTLFSNQHAIALGVLGLEGLTLFFAMLSANASRFLFGTWGMLYRSSLSNPSYGFHVDTILLVQAIVCAIIIVGMPYVLKKRGVFSATRI